MNLIEEIEEYDDIVKVEYMCKTLSGVDVPLLTVSNFAKEHYKKYVIISARVHPGETPASWKMEGFIRWITGSSTKARFLRDRLIFKIVPILNPDGVILGNYRTSISGNDLNRMY